jgi:hypothetical protein
MNRREPAWQVRKIMVLYPVMPKLLQHVPNKVLLINGKGAVHETRRRVPRNPDPEPHDIARDNQSDNGVQALPPGQGPAPTSTPADVHTSVT